MANYGTMVMTQQGMNLFAKSQSGTTLNFTRMQIGSGQLAVGQDPTTLTQLITPISYVSINTLTNNGNTAYVKGVLDNSGITVSTYTCELGLFAQDPVLGEILYAYANAGTQGDTIPPISSGPFSRLFQINAAIGNATSVTATIPANSYVPYAEKGATGGVATLDSGGKLPSTQLPSNVAKTDVAQTWTADQTFNDNMNMGANNESLLKTFGLLQPMDTISDTPTYDSNGNLTQIVYKDGSTVVKTVNYTYTNGNLTQIQELVGGKTRTTTLTYDANNNYTGSSKVVS